MNYKVTLISSDEGYAVQVLGLPSCWSQGQTEQEALENIKDYAIESYLVVVDELVRGQQVRSVGNPMLLGMGRSHTAAITYQYKSFGEK